jgi:pyruvate-formate lyase-activating enzyme
MAERSAASGEERVAVHLAEILALRSAPASALFFSLTRRCPLSCSHCSTNSTLQSEEHAGEMFLRFARSFTPKDRPALLLLTGGEALLRPRLVRELTEIAHAVGTKVYLISGMFFARGVRVPRLIDQAISQVDHFAASLDIFHEREVSRAAVFAALHRLLDRGQDVSMQVVGLHEDDPYLVGLIAEIRSAFQDRVPILVAPVHARGRAAQWLAVEAPQVQTSVPPEPCDMAAWPTAAYDGTIAACCNQTVIDGPVPAHLRLGHLATDSWATVRERCLTSTMLRAIRVFGPEHLVERYGSGSIQCDGYCSTCYRLPGDEALSQRLEPVMATPGMRLIEQQVRVLGQATFLRRYGLGRYWSLATLGYNAELSATCNG